VSLAFSYSLFNDHYNLCFPSIAPFFDDTDDVIQKIKDVRPDVVAFSALTCTYQWNIKIAEAVKKMNPNTVVIFGGVHPSAVPERVLSKECIDAVCVGEGDNSLPTLLKELAEKKSFEALSPIPNLRFKGANGQIVIGPKAPFVHDLDALPFLDKDIWDPYIRIGDLYYTMASRGCPFRCTFCFNNFFAKLPGAGGGKYVRQRSVDHMIAELVAANKKFKLKLIDFEDDIFTVNKAWLKEFLPRFKKEVNVPFQCLTHPKYMDDEVAKWLKEAGCSWVQMGIQSLDEEYKVNELKRYEKSNHIEIAMEAMLKNGINPKIDHMLALPGEPPEAQEKARVVYARYTPARIQTFWTQFLPGTEMMAQVEKSGIINAEEANSINEGIFFDIYRAHNRWLSKDQVRMFHSYQALFKIMTFTPKFLRAKLRAWMFSWMPHNALSMFTFMADLIIGFIRGNPDHFSYSKHYIYYTLPQFIRAVRRRWSKPRPGADDSAFLPEPKSSRLWSN